MNDYMDLIKQIKSVIVTEIEIWYSAVCAIQRWHLTGWN